MDSGKLKKQPRLAMDSNDPCNAEEVDSVEGMPLHRSCTDKEYYGASCDEIRNQDNSKNLSHIHHT